MIYFLRHAVAEERGSTPDADRPLLPEGRDKLRRVLRWADAQGIRPERVWTSPYLRCRQTAQEVQRHFDCTLTLVDQLQPGGGFDELLSVLKEGTMLVGHEPDLSEMVGLLLGAPQPPLGFKKAGMAGLDWDGERGQLQFLVAPRWLKK